MHICEAITKKGTRCKRRTNQTFCFQHRGAATKAKASSRKPKAKRGKPKKRRRVSKAPFRFSKKFMKKRNEFLAEGKQTSWSKSTHDDYIAEWARLEEKYKGNFIDEIEAKAKKIKDPMTAQKFIDYLDELFPIPLMYETWYNQTFWGSGRGRYPNIDRMFSLARQRS